MILLLSAALSCIDQLQPALLSQFTPSLSHVGSNSVLFGSCYPTVEQIHDQSFWNCDLDPVIRIWGTENLLSPNLPEFLLLYFLGVVLPPVLNQTHWSIFPGGLDSKESAGNAGDLGLSPTSGRSPGKGNSYPLQYSCLENPMDRGAWWTSVHGTAENQTRLSDKHFHFFSRDLCEKSRRPASYLCTINFSSCWPDTIR